MRFSRPFCLIRPDFKKKVYEDYEYYVYDNGNIVSTNFTTRKDKKVSCIYNLKTGVGKKTVQDKGIFIETKYEKRNVQETTLRTSAGYITKNFETGFTTIVSDKYGLDHGITKDGQIVELNTEKMYHFWKKFGFYKMPTMDKVKSIMKKIITCRKVL